MQNCSLKAMIYLTMVTLVSLMSVGCGPTEEEYMAKIDEINRYKRLSKQRQTEIANMGDSVKSLNEKLSKTQAEKKRAVAQQQTNKEHLDNAINQLAATKNELKSTKNLLASSRDQLERTEEQLKDYYLKITNLEQTGRELQEKYDKLKENEKKLNAQVDSYNSRLLEEQTAEKNMEQGQQDLLESLRNQLESDKIKITELSNRIAVRLDEQLLFDSGQSFIKASGFKVLKKIGAVLKKIHDKHIQVEGHTDKRPIGGALKRKYATNWELSVARAINVTHYLVNEVKIEPTRISSTGFGQFQPIAENSTPEGRQANRRVEFALLPLRSNADD